MEATGSEPEVVCAGMSTVDVWVTGFSAPPAVGTSGFVDTIGMGVGGDALNQAYTLARLGHPVALLSVVGADSAGAMVRQLSAAAGVDVSGVAVDPELTTSMAVALIDAEGERSFLAHRHGSAHRLGHRHLAPSLLQPGLKVLSVGSLMCSEEFDSEALPPLLDRAHQLGAVTVADMVADRVDATLDDLAPVLQRLDYVVPSLGEVEHYTGTTDLDAAAAIFAGYGVRRVVIKQGSHGATAFDGSTTSHAGSYDVPVLDTTGSGDNFVAGFVSGLAAGLPLASCLQRGAATAALSVQHVGATGGVPGIDAVEDMIKNGRLRPLASVH